MAILNFGSLNIDRVYAVDHFVRPAETLASLNLETFVGGKGLNQSIALARAGAKVYHAGKVGSDGSILVDKLRQSGVDVSHVDHTFGPSGHAIIQVDKSGQNSILLFGGANQEITEHDVDIILADFSDKDLLLLQNEISSMPYLLKEAKKKGMGVALNPSPMTEELRRADLSAVTMFILNELEGKELSGQQQPEKICDALLAKYPDSTVVLTLGSKGAMCANRRGRWRNGIYKVDVVDTTAAGDTFTGYFLAALEEGLSAQKALTLAGKASAIAVGRPGAADSIPLREEVNRSRLHLAEKRDALKAKSTPKTKLADKSEAAASVKISPAEKLTVANKKQFSNSAATHTETKAKRKGAVKAVKSPVAKGEKTR